MNYVLISDFVIARNKVTKQSKIKVLLACLLLSNLMLCGCSSNPPNQPAKNMSELDDLRKIIMVTSLYMTVTGKPPDSTKSIENFCSDFNSPHCGVDWSKIDLQQLDNGKVRIKYKSDTFSATMEISNISQSPSEANSPTKEDIEELLKKLTK